MDVPERVAEEVLDLLDACEAPSTRRYVCIKLTECAGKLEMQHQPATLGDGQELALVKSCFEWFGAKDPDASDKPVDVALSTFQPQMVDETATIANLLGGPKLAQLVLRFSRTRFALFSTVVFIGGFEVSVLAYFAVPSFASFPVMLSLLSLALASLCLGAFLWQLQVMKVLLRSFEVWYVLVNISIAAASGGEMFADPHRRIIWRALCMCLLACGVFNDCHPFRRKLFGHYIASVSTVEVG